MLNKMVDNKKEGRKRNIVVIGVIIILGLQFVSADLVDDFKNIWESITGFATSATSTASVAVASVAPTILRDHVEPPAAQTITEDSYINVTFYFNATDADGG